MHATLTMAQVKDTMATENRGHMNEEYLSAEQVCEMVPKLTRGNLAQLRYTGKGPKFLAPTPRTIIYRRSDVVEWIEASERTSTASVSA